MNFYKEAAEVLDRLDAKRGSIQSNLSSVTEKNRSRTAALVIETLKYKPVLLSIIGATPLLKQEKKHIPSENFGLVLVHDLLFAKRGIQGSDGPIKQALLRHQTRLRAELVKAKIKKGVKDNEGLAQEADPRALRIPRYVRVNTNVWTMDDALNHFKSKHFMLCEPSDDAPNPRSFFVDPHVPTLLAFHPSVAFHADTILTEGKIILQDKASCFPALILSPPIGSRVVDATAAPGNKTSHLSALMGNTGKIIAFERDRRRFGTLQSMLEKARCTNVTAMNRDFLATDPADELFLGVTHILLDPSCSGSGIVNRMDYLVEGGEEDAGQDERLQKLAGFQLMMIRHAMKVKSVLKIVYSTCSVHPEEDEHVVRDALKSQEAQDGGFRLAPASEVLPTWERRGLPAEAGNEEDAAASMIRCSPGEDRTNGFFVACFIRTARQKSQTKKAASDGSTGTTKRKRKNDQDAAMQTTEEKKQKKAKKRPAPT